ncbi:MAG: hypothetical protein V5A68_02145 [Candidatus Thermoplasmatota archaeon]
MNNKKKNIFLVTIVSTLLIGCFTPTIVSEQIEKNNIKKEVEITILDTSQNKKISLTREVSINEIEKLLEMKIDDKKDTSLQQINEKIQLLENMNIISKEKAEKLKTYYAEKNMNLNHKTTGVLFDTINIFNGIFFGLKGEIDNVFLQLNVAQLPFFNSSIDVGVTGYGKFTGSGSVFTVGFFGVNYIYDNNESKYDFPYFSTITGNIIGLSGVLLEMEIDDMEDENLEGNYVFGFGMTVFTFWNSID